MNVNILILVALNLAAILVIALAALGAAEYTLDAALLIAMPLVVKPPYVVSGLAWLLLIAVSAFVRRWPPIATRLLPWPVPAWLLPGAAETLDTEAPPAPEYRAQFMSSAKRVIREERTRELLEQSIRRHQRTLRHYAGTRLTPAAPNSERTPPPIVATTIDGEDAKLAALLFARGKTPAQVARLLTGYAGDKHAEYVAKAEALRAQLGSEAGQ